MNQDLALFQNPAPLALFSRLQLSILRKHAQFDFEWDSNVRPVYAMRDVYHIAATDSIGGFDGEVEKGVRVTSGPLCDSSRDGAVRIRLPQFSVGLISDGKNKAGDLLHTVLFVIPAHGDIRIVMAWVLPANLKGKFALDPSTLTKAFRYSVHTPAGVYSDSGKPRWDHKWPMKSKRVKVADLLKEGWEFAPTTFPSTLNIRSSSLKAPLVIEFMEEKKKRSRRSKHFLLSDGTTTRFYMHEDALFALRRNKGEASVGKRQRENGAISDVRFTRVVTVRENRDATDVIAGEIDGRPIQLSQTIQDFILHAIVI